MRRNSLSLQKKFSTRWRHLDISKSQGIVVTRLALGGITAGSRRDHGGRAPIVQIGADRVAVESLVRQKRAEIEVRQKRGDTGAVVSLARQQDEPHEIAQRIDQRDDLGR